MRNANENDSLAVFTLFFFLHPNSLKSSSLLSTVPLSCQKHTHTHFLRRMHASRNLSRFRLEFMFVIKFVRNLNEIFPYRSVILLLFVFHFTFAISLSVSLGFSSFAFPLSSARVKCVIVVCVCVVCPFQNVVRFYVWRIDAVERYEINALDTIS